MTKKEAIENVKEQLEGIKKANECGLATRGKFNKDINAIETVLNLLEKKDALINTMQAEFERLENLEDNTDMLKLELEKKDKIINEMAPRVYLLKEEREEMKKDIYNNVNHKGFADFVKRYFERKVEEDK